MGVEFHGESGRRQQVGDLRPHKAMLRPHGDIMI